MNQEPKDQGFRVVDKRRFDATGDVKSDAPTDVERAASQTPVRPQAQQASQPQQPSSAGSNPFASAHGSAGRPGAAPQPPRPQQTPPPRPQAAAAPQRPASGDIPAIDFAHFCLSLATSAQVAMGLMPHPEGGPIAQDVNAARQTIDILTMLESKTQGNVSAEEAQLLQEILYTLRMQFVQVSQAPMAGAPAGMGKK